MSQGQLFATIVIRGMETQSNRRWEQAVNAVRLAGAASDPTERSAHMASAIKSARLATLLSPNMIGMALNYAKLLSEENRDYDSAIKEAERGLAIMQPFGERVVQTRRELRSLIDKCKAIWLTIKPGQDTQAEIDVTDYYDDV